MPAPVFTIIGAAHADHTIRLVEKTKMHRTNPATMMVMPGGVAANIARHLGGRHMPKGHSPHFIGVAARGYAPAMERDFARWNIRPHLVEKDGAPSSYTAIIDADGDLVIGAANMDLYDQVEPDDIIGLLPSTGLLIIDANFSGDVLLAIAEKITMAVSLFAAATSTQKAERLIPILSRLDGLVLNRVEAERLVTGDDMAEMAHHLVHQMRGHAFVLISDADNDAVLVHRDIVVTSRPPKITPVNVNGAGDAMAAAVFAAVGRGMIKGKVTPARLQSVLDDAVAAGAAFAAGEM